MSGSEWSIGSVTGVTLLLVMLICGRQFRETWKAQTPGWERRAWIWGVPVVLSFAVLVFVPLRG
jgi:hypothetical protein